ncbi:unnamed protein product [Prunus brigantina]
MWDARGVVVFFGQMDVERAGMFLLLDLPIGFGGPRIKHRNIYYIHLWSPLTYKLILWNKSLVNNLSKKKN